MKIRTLLIVTLSLAGALYWFCQQEQPTQYSDMRPEPDNRVVAPIDAAPEPRVPQPPAQPVPTAELKLRAREELPNAVPMKIHWSLKLPGNSDLTRGTFVFRNQDSFNTYLGSKNQCFARWNNVDFKKQMAIVRLNWCPELRVDSRIDSVVRTNSEIVVFVKHTVVPADAMFPAAIQTYADGIVINRSELPVRFSDFDVLAP